jgi:serine protease
VHPELKDQLVAGYDFVSDATKSGDGDGIDADPSDEGDWDQTCYTSDAKKTDCWSSWHGTHVAGIIAAKQDTNGITGIAPGVKIQPVRVLGLGGEGSSIDLAMAIMWAAGFSGAEITNVLQYSRGWNQDISSSIREIKTNKTPAKVLNLSMAGLGQCPSDVDAAVKNAMAVKDVMIVAAAGNGSGDRNTPDDNGNYYPTNCLGPISVGATGYTNDAAFYSNYGVDISAPGGDQRVPANNSVANSGMIYSTSNTGATEPDGSTYKYEMGTSMAAPLVSGILALMYSLRPNATRDQVWTALRDSALPFKTGGICALAPGRCGSGIANAANALRALIAITG